MKENTRVAKSIVSEALDELGESYHDTMNPATAYSTFMSQMSKSGWTADAVTKAADTGTNKGYGIYIKNTKTRYKYMIMMRESGRKIKVIFDFGRDEFVGTAQEVADHVNKILGIKEETEVGISKTSEESLTESAPRGSWIRRGGEAYHDTMKFMSQMSKSGWTADAVTKAADMGSDKGHGIYIQNTKTRYKHMIMMREGGRKIKVSFDFGRDKFVGTAQEVADHVNKILGIKEETEGGSITEATGYRKVKDLDRTKSLWELRTTNGMSYLVVSYSPHVDETAVFRSDKNGKVSSFIEVYSTRGRLEPEPIIRDIASGKIEPMDDGPFIG